MVPRFEPAITPDPPSVVIAVERALTLSSGGWPVQQDGVIGLVISDPVEMLVFNQI